MTSLDSIRQQIDSLDRMLLENLAQRFALAKQTRALKSDTFDPSREEEVRTFWQQAARELDLSPSFAEEILDLLLTESKRLQDAA